MMYGFGDISNSLKARLLFWVWLTSSLATFIFTNIQLFSEYNKEKSLAMKQLTVVENNYLPSITESLWEYNNRYLNLQIQSLKNLPYIDYISVISNERVVVEENIGKVPLENLHIESYPLTYNQKIIGELKIGLDILSIKEVYFYKAITILVAQALKTFIVCYFLMIVFSKVIMRHITKITNFLEHFKIDDRNMLHLNRPADVNDEFTVLATNINSLKDKLQLANNQLLEFNRNLEKKVQDKTRELEVERAKSVEAARLASLGEMAGGIAHEINNPLAIISSSITYLKKLASKGKLDNDSLKSVVDDIETTLIRIAKIIKGLRNVSRDTGETKKDITSLDDIVDDIIGLCSEKFRNNGVKLELNLDKGKILYCDRIKISQALINLLGNAFDAAIEEEEKWVKADYEEDAQFDYLKITDSGHGIPKDIKEKIFNPFFTSKDIGKGTGLGLSITKAIIEEHGGTITIDESCPNTCFIMKFPKAEISEQKKII